MFPHIIVSLVIQHAPHAMELVQITVLDAHPTHYSMPLHTHATASQDSSQTTLLVRHLPALHVLAHVSNALVLVLIPALNVLPTLIRQQSVLLVMVASVMMASSLHHLLHSHA
jgi:hypothetical protein